MSYGQRSNSEMFVKVVSMVNTDIDSVQEKVILFVGASVISHTHALFRRIFSLFQQYIVGRHRGYL